MKVRIQSQSQVTLWCGYQEMTEQIDCIKLRINLTLFHLAEMKQLDSAFILQKLNHILHYICKEPVKCGAQLQFYLQYSLYAEESLPVLIQRGFVYA